MKKISLSVLGAVLLVVSCQKNESSLPQTTDDPLQQSTEGMRKCGSMDVLAEQLRTDPERASRLENLERNGYFSGEPNETLCR